eukprot:1148579-Pelagomonas_calceolata.AAC.7
MRRVLVSNDVPIGSKVVGTQTSSKVVGMELRAAQWPDGGQGLVVWESGASKLIQSFKPASKQARWLHECQDHVLRGSYVLGV